MLPATQISLDEMFDLDLALTMPEPDDSNMELNKHHSDAPSTEAVRHLVDKLPAVVMGGGDHCAVCMEGFTVGGKGKQIPCGHTFHENCICQWLCIHDSCPLCRGVVSINS
ncbi:hypothetical protein CDL12_25350 [Handroanthus impetiginosus]|uniref:RING-type domain-containing protein n=1 Tax=Handroanthus impetiginosus TaxID=429701 RepID=A0A2G9GA27_9LAMI|nr:hypothetical protein CDL12_25350 [Handroanthus impetiginosus]